MNTIAARRPISFSHRISDGGVYRWVLAIIGTLSLPIAVWGQSDQHYTVTRIDYAIEGTTRQWVLEQQVPLEVGQQFISLDELERQIEETRRILGNIRVLATSDVSYRLEMPPQDGAKDVGVVVTIATVDTGNVVLLPSLKFDSNSGLVLAARFRNYNFFGTLSPLVINLDYVINETGDNSVGLAPRLTLPFHWLGYQWTWELDAALTYTVNGPFEGAVNTSIAIALPTGPVTWELTFLQGLEFDIGDPTAFPYQLINTLSFGTSIDTGLSLPFVGSINYAPMLSTRIDYRFGEPDGIQTINGADFSFTHGINTGRIDWVGNLRNGILVELANSWNFNTNRVNVLPVISLNASGYLAVTPFGFSARVGGFYRFPYIGGIGVDQEKEAARYIRGIRNSHMSGNIGFYFNSDITLSLFVIPREVMGLIIPGVGLLLGDVEAQGSIFFDVGLSTDTNAPFVLPDDLRYSIGVEGIGYPLLNRSFFVRLSIGVDPQVIVESGALFGGENPEIFFGFGHHY